MKDKAEKLKFFQKLTLFFFRRPRQTALIWLVITIFGIACYTTFLKREGFPSVETPFAIAKGTYLVNDPAKVDKKVAGPLNDFLVSQAGVKNVQSTAQGNFYSVIISYNDNINAAAKSQELKQAVLSKHLLPSQATLEFDPVKFGFTDRGDDLVVSFYPTKPVSVEELNKKAQEAADYFKSKNLSLVKDLSLISQIKSGTNPLTGKTETQQQSFDRFGIRQGGENNFYNSVIIGFTSKKGADNLDLDSQVQSVADEINNSSVFAGYKASISASYAPQIKAQISELQRVLLEGLIAVLVIGSLVIAVRASLLTVISMVSVLAIVNGVLYLIGYSLNTITLFSLILALSLIIDDTIIMVEALDAQKRRLKDASEAVKIATGKVSRAMVAATLTAALSFSPLIFVGGILGKFIRAIPITIISALLMSLIVAFIFIPLFARFLILTKKQMGRSTRSNAFNFEHKLAEMIAAPMLAVKDSKKKLAGVGIVAVLIGFLFIGAGGYLFQKVHFNIFPASKDSNELRVTLNFPPDTTVENAQAAVDNADKIIGDTLGGNFQKASYYGGADTRTAIGYVDLIDYKERAVKSPELVSTLNDKFAGFKQANVNVSQVDPGPPASDFTARVDSSKNRAGALRLRDDIKAYLEHVDLRRIDGTQAKIKTVLAGNSDIYNREGHQQYVDISASFVDNDTTTLVTLAKDAVQKEFTASKVASYGLSKNALSFNFGQEDENQNSFKTLAISFPIVLAAIYILLAFQFRSFIQPLLIFMAIPFSLFGITLGLYLTSNDFSFFAMLGFFALIGLSIKNTILLTDYANQSRRRGSGPVDAIHEALGERFRPLIATSLTAVVSLIPLAITSPFWEGLTVVLIFGLLSSTFLVITVFPYYYLGGEYIRLLGRRAVAKIRK